MATVTSTPTPSVIKRNPVVVAGAVLGLLEAFIAAAPQLGLKLPTFTQSAFAALVAVAGAFGVSTKTRPLALSVPATPAEAKAAEKIPSSSVLDAVVRAAKPVAGIAGAAKGALGKLKGRK